MGLLQGHGLGKSTPVKTVEGVQPIKNIKPRKKIIGYDTKLNRNLKTSVRTTGYSVSNCYIRIRCNMPGVTDLEEILCTPTQEFYRIKDNSWIPAIQLGVGDILKSNTDNSFAITQIELINEPLDVYALEVRKCHNFCIGKYGLLTHNTALPWEVVIGISIPLGEAATGGAAGSFFGPIGVVGGIIVGSILGCGLQYLENRDKIYQYEAFFDAETINALIKGSLNNPSKSKNVPPGGGGPSSPEDPDKDPDKNNIKQERITIFENNAQHIFRNKDGHLRSDTPENRKILEDLVNDKKNYLDSSSRGARWYAKPMEGGKQLWAEVRGNQIRNGGINDIPKEFDPVTGLSRNISFQKSVKETR